MNLIFDIGGTNLRIAIGDKKIKKINIVPTPKKYDQGLKTINSEVLKFKENYSIEQAVLGIAGPLNQDKNSLHNSLNLQDWAKKPLKIDLENLLQIPVTLQNDAALAGLGEAKFGAGEGFDHLAYITIGTGIGGAKIYKNEVDEALFGFEPGYQILKEDKSFQNLVSGKAIVEKFGKQAHDLSLDEWQLITPFIAQGIYNLVVCWSPEIVILGGAVSQFIPLEQVENHLDSYFPIIPLPPIKKAALGDSSGLTGALYLANQL